MSKGIKIKPIYNSVLFQVECTPGDARRTFPSYGIYERTIPEGYYMKRKAPKKINPISNFFKRIYNGTKGFIGAKNLQKIEQNEGIKNIKDTTIEIQI